MKLCFVRTSASFAMSSWPDFRVLLDKSVNAVAVSFFFKPENDILWRTGLGAPQNSHYSVAHQVVRHRIAYFVATILWRTTHAPQNRFLVRHRIGFLY